MFGVCELPSISSAFHNFWSFLILLKQRNESLLKILCLLTIIQTKQLSIIVLNTYFCIWICGVSVCKQNEMRYYNTILLFFATILISLIQTGCKANDLLYTVPFKLYDDVAVIKVSINGSKPLNFIFDTGTTTSLIDSITATTIGLISEDSQALLLNNDYLEMPMAKMKTLKAGNVVIQNRPVIITQSFENYNRILGIPINGIIGMDFFGKYITELNFDKMQINLGSNIDTTGYMPINAKIHNDLFYIDASIFTSSTDSVSNRFLFDTADLTAISLAEPFWEKNDLLNKCRSYYSGINRSSSSHASPSYFGNFNGIGLYNYRFNNVYINLTSSKRGFFANDSIAGTIGIDILKRFNIVINLKDEKLYLQPNKNYNDPYRINTSGLRARLNKELTQCIIEAVLQHSPAEEAGLTTGDIIESINNIKADKENMSQIRKLTRSVPGTKLTFIIHRGVETKQLSFVCKEFSDK